MIHTPGVFVQRIIQTNTPKRIEVRTTRKREPHSAGSEV
jgi:hypothetical protein